MRDPWTPGPWMWWTSCSFRRLSSNTTGKDGDVLHAVVQRSDGHPDVVLPNGGWNGPDGRLIAAAPELAAALRLWEAYDDSADDVSMMIRYAEAIETTRALLARIRNGGTEQ